MAANGRGAAKKQGRPEVDREQPVDPVPSLLRYSATAGPKSSNAEQFAPFLTLPRKRGGLGRGTWP